MVAMKYAGSRGIVFEQLRRRLFSVAYRLTGTRADAEPSVTEAAKQLAESLSDIVELRSGPRHDITLVRPDGYVAYSAHNHDGIAALKSVRSVLERQTN